MGIPSSLRPAGRLAAVVTAVTLVVGPLVAVPAASAAVSTASRPVAQVTINKMSTKTAPYGKKVTIKPAVTATGQVSVKSKALTVKKSGKTVAKAKKSVALKPGTYTVSTKVTYKTYSVKSSTKTVTKQKVGVAAYTDVAVTCNAVSVVPNLDWADVVASCTSSKYDGARKVSLTLWQVGADYWGIDSSTLDELTTSAAPRQGATFSAVLNPGSDLKKTYTTKQTTQTKVWSGLKTKTRTQTLVVKQGKKPSRTTPISAYSCPSWAPIKGNRTTSHTADWIYHVPGGRYYKATKPEECFITASAARNAGYRASRNG